MSAPAILDNFMMRCLVHWGVRIIATGCNHTTSLSYRHVSVCFPADTPFQPAGGAEVYFIR
jgi:hypothetical protein